ncbi:agmatine deiminase family protein [Iodobacter sp. CM08]|uniref:agmatine deiminase family protein n=1 Tax=Iodobacter sp. CM08 TaxID=3085902 RepID=UPI002982769B|nr:agmatine deiminase family protein [Iodobacter sp. CM08]MDW5415927.1 agmatine deiminase family protein [Iodobacter sp. CM08]
MNSRRHFLKQSLIGSSALILATTHPIGSMALAAPNDNAWRMPDEGEQHAATWMAFGPSEEIWGKRLQAGAQENLARIALTIAAFEPVKMLVREADYDSAERLCGSKIELIVQPIDDLWVRDTGAVFVKNSQGKTAAVDFNFNGWGNKQAHAQDRQVARFICTHTKTLRLETQLVLEGGGIEVDGQGTGIITESCVLNANRNAKLSKAQCETELKRLLGLKKIIWLPGIKGKDITDGHTDFYARFTSPGVVVAGFDADPTSYDHAVTQRHLDILRKATDAMGRKLKVVVLEGPSSVRKQYENKEFAAGYINFYACNGAIIAPEFGDNKADRNTKDTLQDLFPEREIVMLNIDAIAAGGGGIHCTTQQQIA